MPDDSPKPPPGVAYQSPRLKTPTARGLTILAIRVLEQALADAREAPIEMTDVVRLALGTLLREGIAVDQAGRALR